jgi:hypothetical protein
VDVRVREPRRPEPFRARLRGGRHAADAG